MRISSVITAVDAHAEGEPGRVITAGLPQIPGASVYEKMRWLEAMRTGNPLTDETADWCDYEQAGASSPDELEDHVIELLGELPIGGDLYDFGLRGTIPASTNETVKARVVGG